MDLSTQPLFQSSAADCLLLASHLRLNRATVVSGRWRPFSVSSSFSRNHCRFPSRPSFATNDKNGFAYSNLGFGAFRAQPSFLNGLRISWEHRSGYGTSALVRDMDVFKRPASALRIVPCP